MPIINLGRIAFVNKGTYQQNTDYKILDVVVHNGLVYSCKVEHTSPASGFTATNWTQWTTATLANGITFNNAVSGLLATTVQDAIDELNQKIIDIVGGAPEALNTLNELAQALSDDYEKGTFTPSIISGATDVVYATQIGKYTKIGSRVFWEIDLKITSSTPNGSNLRIGGFPYPAGLIPASGAFINYHSSFFGNEALKSNVSFHMTQGWNYIGVFDWNGFVLYGNSAGVLLNGRLILSGFYDI